MNAWEGLIEHWRKKTVFTLKSLPAENIGAIHGEGVYMQM